MKDLSLVSRPDSLVCPLCESGGLRPVGNGSMRCGSCDGSLGGAILEALRRITGLQEALGSHACECGHPEMRCLPDGVFHCPSCGSDVLPIDAHVILSEPDKRGEAWWAGWMDGHFGERGSFVDNPNLVKWETPSERLAYYQGHRAGSQVRQAESGRRPQAHQRVPG
jgi:ribosomal protein L37AE/L43A